ncbi:unnamed protein product [Owenia fusiformis]|uniref:Uncharacterized protein n=1 Tax=Owenia fusiformis TaxID=6347 RepID=A0A8J1XK73_OWEFU|nr:unnamed protein product [Owenia fusiformis]
MGAEPRCMQIYSQLAHIIKMQSLAVISFAVVLLGVFQRGTAIDENGVIEGVLKRILEDLLDSRIQVKELDASSIKDPAPTALTECIGDTSLIGLGRTFRRFDDDGSKSIEFEEFLKGLVQYGCQIGFNQSGAKQLFDSLNNGKEKLSFDDFVEGIPEPLSDEKKESVIRTFKKADSNHDGVLTLNDDMISERVFKNMDEDNNGEVNIQDFANYCKMIYPWVSDEHFDFFLRNMVKSI